MNESLLSLASIGGEVPFKKEYIRHGFRIKCLNVYRFDRQKRYRVCVIAPVQGWYPSKTGNFVFFDVNMDPEFILKLAPTHFNPSVWRHKTKRFVLRVSKDREMEMRTLLYKKGYWYNPGNNFWKERLFVRAVQRKESIRKRTAEERKAYSRKKTGGLLWRK